MPKTRDAFALRDLYMPFADHDENDELIFFPPNFSADNRSSYHLGNNDEYLGTRGWVEEEALLEYLWSDEMKFPDQSLTGIELAKGKISYCKAKLASCVKKAARIERHMIVLEQFYQRLFDKAVSGGLTAELQDKGRRAKKLIEHYDDLMSLLRYYYKVVVQDLRASEEMFKQVYRKEFGARLRQARLRNGLTMEQLAKKLSMSTVGYGYYERGQRDLPTPTIYALAQILHVSTDWLFGLTE